MTMDRLIAEIIPMVRPYSMVPDEGLAFTIEATLTAIDEGIAGVIVECGTWLGGASFAMLLAQRLHYGRIVKPVWMFDSFAGLPPVDERDGPAAFAWQRATDSPGYMDNCAVALDDVRRARDAFGFGEEVCRIVPGWFDATVPEHSAALDAAGIGILRVDCDWYAPVRCVLDGLTPHVVDDGFVIVDDYYFWDGCALATHDFLAEQRLSWRLKSIANYHGAFMRKRPHRMDRP